MDSGTASSAAAAAPNQAPAAPGEPLSLVLEEKLAVVLRRDGSLEDKMEVQGSIMLQARSCTRKGFVGFFKESAVPLIPSPPAHSKRAPRSGVLLPTVWQLTGRRQLSC